MATTFTDGTDNPAIFPANALKRSPYASPETPAGQAIGRAASGVANAFSFPDTRSVIGQAGDEAKAQAAQGNYGQALGTSLRGALAAFPAAAVDMASAVPRAVGSFLPSGSNPTQQLKDFGSQVLTGQPAIDPNSNDPNRLPLYTPPQFESTTPAASATPAAPATPAVTPPGVGTPGVTSADRVAQMGRDATSLRALSDRSLQNSALGIGVPGTPGMGVMDAGVADARQKFFDEASLRTAAAQSSWSPRGGFKANDAAIQAAAVPIQNRQRLQELSLKNAGDQSIARMRDATDRRGQDISAETAAGAQAVTLRGQELTARTAANAARLDQSNKDRQYALDVQKYGTEVADKNLKARSDAETSFQKDAETMFRTTDKDGKNIPDEAKVASWKTAVNTTLAEIAKAHEASGDPARMKIAQGIRDRGYAALDPAEKRELQQLFNTRERLQQSRGMGPNAGSYTHSDNLLSFRQRSGDAGVDRRIFGGDRAVFDNGSSASIRDLQYRDGPANALMPDVFRQRSDELTRNLRGF